MSFFLPPSLLFKLFSTNVRYISERKSEIIGRVATTGGRESRSEKEREKEREKGGKVGTISQSIAQLFDRLHELDMVDPKYATLLNKLKKEFEVCLIKTNKTKWSIILFSNFFSLYLFIYFLNNRSWKLSLQWKKPNSRNWSICAWKTCHKPIPTWRT